MACRLFHFQNQVCVTRLLVLKIYQVPAKESVIETQIKEPAPSPKKKEKISRSVRFNELEISEQKQKWL